MHSTEGQQLIYLMSGCRRSHTRFKHRYTTGLK
jgi:hypothetical protein